jgi:serine/threonine-protein kinase
MGGTFEPGEVFADRYVIEAQLGVGAAGVVVSATHTDLKQRVAIKLLRDTAPVGVERMVREARAALSLHSEHVVRVMDVGRDREGHAFIVMEQLEGADLGTLLQQRGSFGVCESVDYVLQACAGIAEAHARGIVHRDLKPSNLFLTKRADGTPLVKVLDFGISKSSSDEDAETSLTGPAEMIGSPRYMSPEQVRGEGVDHRSDIWALGVILYRFLSGAAPFGGKGRGISGALTSIVMDSPQPLAQLVPDVPAGLDAVVLRCLEKTAEARPASAAELAARLAPFASGEGQAAVARLVRSVEGKLAAEVASNSPARQSRLALIFAGPQRRFLLGGIVVASIAISAAAFALLGHKGAEPSESPVAVAAAAPEATTATPTPTVAATAIATAIPAPTPVDPTPAVAVAPQPAIRHAQPVRPAQPQRSRGTSSQANPSSTNASSNAHAAAAAIDDRY